MIDTDMVFYLRSASTITTSLVLRRPALRYDGYQFGSPVSGVIRRPSRTGTSVQDAKEPGYFGVFLG